MIRDDAMSTEGRVRPLAAKAFFRGTIWLVMWISTISPAPIALFWQAAIASFLKTGVDE